MNVYDFDGTIYDGDSTLDFYFHELKKRPSIVRWLPKQLFAAVKYKLGVITKKEFKQTFFIFIKDISNVDEEVNVFWDRNMYKIKKWYWDNKKEGDVIISASPDFLLSAIIERLGNIVLIATKVSAEDGMFLSENCYGAEKINRFNELFADQSIDCFYSDSKSDLPMARIAGKAFLVKKNTIEEWLV